MTLIQDLFIYPIKSLGGIRVEQAYVTERGLQYDRRFMLVDAQHRFLSQREHPEMALLKTAIEGQSLLIAHAQDPSRHVDVSLEPATGDTIRVDIWDDTCNAITVSAEADRWFSAVLGMECTLVYMPDSSLRQVDLQYGRQGDITSFSDGYPILVIAQASLDDLNGRLQDPIPMNRFRPNIVLSGKEAFVEDRMGSFTINGIPFAGVKPCARCVMTTIDQATAVPGKEPLKTLSAYRNRNNKVLFGQNVIARGRGQVHVGDGITVEQWLEPLFA